MMMSGSSENSSIDDGMSVESHNTMAGDSLENDWMDYAVKTGMTGDEVITLCAEVADEAAKEGILLAGLLRAAKAAKQGPIDPSTVIEHAKKGISLLLRDISSNSDNVGRGPSITDGLDTELAHKHDLDAFLDRLIDHFKWHDIEAEREKYLAPYFTLVQSSGMGKTKLFVECSRVFMGIEGSIEDLSQSTTTKIEKYKCKTKCMTILCVDTKESKEGYYDGYLLIDKTNSPAQIKETVRTKLNEFAKPYEEDNDYDHLILLFDEAQGLMKGTDGHNRGSLGFRAVRWWLRENHRLKVVASFAGTTAKLSNFYPPDPPTQGASRVAKQKYKNYQENSSDDKQLYPPFFKLYTISCFAEERLDDNAEPGFPDAARFGRPLFPYYQKKGNLKEYLKEFALRLVLSEKEYQDHLPSCYSVLGTRVQMGIVNSFDTVSTLVSSGYACLVDFQQQENKLSLPLARLTFMPDPLCATLAMFLMDENWNKFGLEGRSGKFWVKQAERALSTKLCLPDKGDVGEIFAALYMLLCGDILRREKDGETKQSLKLAASFSVCLHKWFRLLKTGGKRSDADQNERAASSLANVNVSADAFVANHPRTQAQLKTTSTPEAPISCSISFVQVCRNDFRSNSFCEEKVLRHMYVSGLASYAYKNCKAIDIASSIKVVQTSGTTYHPLLISVKNWDTVSKSDAGVWFSSLKAFLEEMRNKKEHQPTAVCLIILLGCSDPPTLEGDNLHSENLQPFPSDDVFRLIAVPKSDEFGVSVAINNLGKESEECEMYSSHGFLKFENDSKSVLRKESENQILVDDLFQAINGSSKKRASSDISKASEMCAHSDMSDVHD